MSLGVGDCGPVGHPSNCASPRTANGDCLRTRLGRDDQLAGAKVGARQARAREDQQAVRPARRRARGSHIREVRGAAATELWRDEADRLDPDVSTRGKSRLGDKANTTAGTKGVDPPAYLVDGNQRASEAAEGAGCHCDSALNVRSASCYGPGSAAAIECVECRRARCERRDQKAITEATDGVDGDPGWERPDREIGKPAAPAAPIHADDPGSRVRVEREDHIPPEGATRAWNPVALARAMYGSPGDPG